MKNIKTLLTIFLVAALAAASNAQNVNWASLRQNQKHLVNLNIGWDYSASLGFGYGYKHGVKMPILFNGQFSLPSGDDLTDDFKAKLGGQWRVLKAGNFIATALVYGIYRRYQSDMVTFQNFGSDFTAVAGYYRTRWFMAAEFGFDKAVTTHVKSSEKWRENNPVTPDGWYIPTGGNFHYGIQAGGSVGNLDTYLSIGKTADQYFKATALIPFYFQLGANIRF